MEYASTNAFTLIEGGPQSEDVFLQTIITDGYRSDDGFSSNESGIESAFLPISSFASDVAANATSHLYESDNYSQSYCGYSQYYAADRQSSQESQLTDDWCYKENSSVYHDEMLHLEDDDYFVFRSTEKNPLTETPSPSTTPSPSEGSVNQNRVTNNDVATPASTDGLVFRETEPVAQGHKPKARHFMCETCGCAYSSKFALNRHAQTHLGEKIYKCHLCSKEFARSDTYRQHLRHHGVDPELFCPSRRKTSQSQSAPVFRPKPVVPIPAPTPAEVKPRVATKSFTCLTCSKTFTDHQNFRRHERTHTGDRPFVCQVCNHSFNQSSNLRRHMKIHENILKKPPSDIVTSFSSLWTL